MSLPARSMQRWMLLWVVALLALLFLLRVQIFNGFTLLTGDIYDGRIEISILQHWYNVLRGIEAWDQPSYFYPYTDTLGYNDGYFLYGLIYSLARAGGVDPVLASEFVNVTVRLIGFFALYGLAVDLLGLPAWWAILAALVFTISNGSYLHASHQQLLAVAFVPLFYWLCWKSWTALITAEAAAARWGCAAALFYAAWMLTTFYMAWFAALFALVTIGSLLVLASASGQAFGPELRRLASWPIALSAVVLAVGLLPFLHVYLPKARETGQHSFQEIFGYLPSPLDLLHVGDGNRIGGVVDRMVTQAVQAGAAPDWEHLTGYPPFLLLLAFAALVLFCRMPVRPRGLLHRALGVATVLCLLLCLKVDGFSLWYGVFHFVPGAGAIRVVSRFLLFLDLPIVLLATIFLADRARSWSPLILLVLATSLVVEEINIDGPQHLDRVAQIRLDQLVPPAPAECRSFYVSRRGPPLAGEHTQVDALYHHNIDGMYLSELRALPTINGHATFDPFDASLYQHVPAGPVMIRLYVAAHGIGRGFCGLDLAAYRWTIGLPALAALPNDGVIWLNRPGPGIAPYMAAGWSAVEAPGRWTDGSEAVLEFILPASIPAGRDVHLRVDASPLATDRAAASPVDMLANGVRIASWRPAAHQHVFEAIIPATLIPADRHVRLAFEILAPRTPRSLGLSSDPRRLGLYVHMISLALQ